MFVLLPYFLAAQIIFGVIFSSIGLLKVRQRMLALREETLAADTSVQTYQRFAAAHRSITYPPLNDPRILLFGLITSIVVLPAAFSYTFDPLVQAFPEAFWQMDPFGLVLSFLSFLALLIGYWMGRLVFSLAGPCVVDAEAVRVFHLSRLQRHEILTLALRSTLLTLLPVILCFEAVALPFLSDPPFTVFLFANAQPTEWFWPLLFFSALWVAVIVTEIIDAVFAVPLYAFTRALQPIAQTPWASLGPRIAAYARLAAVEFSSIQVQQDLPGTFVITLQGLGKPMLTLSEFFLRHSEWRQQDALACLVIGLARKRMSHHVFARKLVSSVLILFLLLLVFSEVLLQSLEPRSALLILTLVGIGALFIGSNSYFRRLQTRDYREAERIAAFLTGDPVALMVALDVLEALNGWKPDHASERMRQLDELAHQSWPHAPQASLPVPAVGTLGSDSSDLSTSLDQATSPDPVPGTPYQKLPD